MPTVLGNVLCVPAASCGSLLNFCHPLTYCILTSVDGKRATGRIWLKSHLSFVELENTDSSGNFNGTDELTVELGFIDHHRFDFYIINTVIFNNTTVISFHSVSV